MSHEDEETLPMAEAKPAPRTGAQAQGTSASASGARDPHGGSYGALMSREDDAVPSANPAVAR